MSEYFDHSASVATLPHLRTEADTIAEDKADFAAADGKWEAAAQPGLSDEQRKHLAAVATASQEKIDDEFYHAFVK